jgi:hypothetical protein
MQKELKMTEEQVAGVDKLQKQWRDAVKDFRDWADKERGARMNAANKALDAGIAKLLKPAQAERFEQVLLQHLLFVGRFGTSRARPMAVVAPASLASRGRSGGMRAVLFYEPAVEKLALTDRQKERADALYADTVKVEQMIQTELGRRRLGEGPADNYASTFDAFSKAADKKYRAVLTTKQQEQLDKMLGEPFQGTFRGRFGGGGFFGPGGP